MTEPQYTSPRLCAAPGCTKAAAKRKRVCSMHADRFCRFGSFDLPAHIKPRNQKSDSPLPGEEWRPVVGHEGVYQVSNFGRIGRAGCIRKLAFDTHGYLSVNLCHSGKRKTVTVHILVAAAFIGPRPTGMAINHIDSDRTNARADNLEYVTPSANQLHAVHFGFHKKGGDSYFAKLNDAAVRDIRSSTLPHGELAKRYQVSIPTIRLARSGQSWKHVN